MISGRIISTEKETVDFATVYLKGTSYGGTTNQDFTLYIKSPTPCLLYWHLLTSHHTGMKGMGRGLYIYLQVLTDVTTEVLAFELYLLSLGKRFGKSLILVLTI